MAAFAGPVMTGSMAVGVGSPPVPLPPVHEPRVDADRDVVQEEPSVDPSDVHPPFVACERRKRGQWVVAIEPDVPCEVVAGPERDAHERHSALQRHRRDRAERAVAARGAEHRRIGAAGELDQVLAGRAQHARTHAHLLRGARELVGCRRPLPGARVDEEDRGQAAQPTGVGPGRAEIGPFGSCGS